ncbi:MAG: fibronectin type III domain-containing protein [Lachnospiraceae bacterium]|nr:fibronectin type III domain-containing protein [Lachnospiraceae bacterium]
MAKKMRCKWISCILSVCMILTLMPNCIVSAQGEVMNVNGSKLQMWIGEEQVCGADSVSTGDVREFNGIQLYKIYSGAEYDVYAKINADNEAEELYIQPTCTDGTLDIPGIRILGRGEVCLLCSVMEGVAESEQITVNLNAYEGTDEARKGYAVYSQFLAEEDGGHRSDKVKFSMNDGAIHTDEVSGVVSGSSINVNGTIKATSFSSTDVVAINFGSEAQPLDYALEFVYGQEFQDWDVDDYYEIEIFKAKTNAYINKSFVKDGSYLDGLNTVSNCYKSLWIYNDAALTITDANKDDDSENILGNVETMRVMTGGSIDIVGEESTGNAIKVPDNVKASYYSSLGTYRNIEQDGQRITDFVETVNCVVDSDAEGYNAETNPTPHKDTEGIYSYTKSNSLVSLVSTSKSLSIIGVEQNIEHGHFEVESGSGIMNEKGDFWAEEGTLVTFTLVPDAGYQYKPGTFCSNGYPVGDNNILFKKTEEPGVYIYTMGPNACSITCEFEQANDEMDVQSENVGDVSIDMGKNDLSGTMEFEVSDAADISDNTKIDIEEKAGEYEVGSVLDLSLDQKINTITGEDAWKTNITELQHNMSISLSLDKNLADEGDYEIIRVHDGVSDVVETSYNPDTDTLTFDTDRFSIYAIAYKKASPHTHVGTKIDKVKATSAANGVKEYYKCSCGKYFEDASCKKEITDLNAWKNGAGRIAAAKSISLSATAYAYDGKVKKPAVTVQDDKGTKIATSNYDVSYGSGKKNVGTYTVKVTFKGDYSGTVTKSFKINPKGTTISGITAKSKGFKVKWKKNRTQTTGYQIQYSTSSKFKGAKTVTVSKNKTTNKTISKLKAKKKYFVRIRTYKKTGSAKYYSSWSKAKKVSTKR